MAETSVGRGAVSWLKGCGTGGYREEQSLKGDQGGYKGDSQGYCGDISF